VTTSAAGDVRARAEAAIAIDIAPALSAHAGGIELLSADESRVVLRFVRSCDCCYFRKACAVNLVEATLHAELGEQVDVVIEGVPR
jgi:Fe-S cluster biogenesis protein NfuA